MRSAAHVPTPTWRLLMEVSCSIWGRTREGQVLLVVSVGQLRWLNRQACVCCGTTRSHRCRQCNSCGSDTPLRGFRFGRTPSRTDDSPDIRTQRPAVRATRSATPSGPRRTSGRQPASELPHPGRRSDRPRQAAALRASPGPRRWHSPRCGVL